MTMNDNWKLSSETASRPTSLITIFTFFSSFTLLGCFSELATAQFFPSLSAPSKPTKTTKPTTPSNPANNRDWVNKVWNPDTQVQPSATITPNAPKPPTKPQLQTQPRVQTPGPRRVKICGYIDVYSTKSFKSTPVYYVYNQKLGQFRLDWGTGRTMEISWAIMNQLSQNDFVCLSGLLEREILYPLAVAPGQTQDSNKSRTSRQVR